MTLTDCVDNLYTTYITTGTHAAQLITSPPPQLSSDVHIVHIFNTFSKPQCLSRNIYISCDNYIRNTTAVSFATLLCYVTQMHSYSEVTIRRQQLLCLSTNCLPHFANCPLGMYSPVVAVVVWSVVLCWECPTDTLHLQTTADKNKMMAQWQGATVNINATMQLQSVQVQL